MIGATLRGSFTGRLLADIVGADASEAELEPS